MNTPRSMLVGWAALIAAAGVSFYYAKQDIDARRRIQANMGTRPLEKKNWYDRLEENPRSGSTQNPPLPTTPPDVDKK